MPDSVLKLTEGNGKMVKLKQLRPEFFFTAACRRSIIALDLNYSPIRSIFKL